MLQLHQRDQQFNCLLRCGLYWRLDGTFIAKFTTPWRTLCPSTKTGLHKNSFDQVVTSGETPLDLRGWWNINMMLLNRTRYVMENGHNAGRTVARWCWCYVRNWYQNVTPPPPSSPPPPPPPPPHTHTHTRMTDEQSRSSEMLIDLRIAILLLRRHSYNSTT